MGPDLKNAGQEPAPRRGRGLLWFIAGGIVAVVLIIAFPSIKDALKSAEKSTVQHAGALKKRLTRQKAGSAATSGGPHFDFYRLLSHPTQILTSHESREVATPPPSRPVSQPGSYVLQVASFRNGHDARALKAQLALWGIRAEVQSVNVQGETWHRVRIGPVSDLKTLNSLRDRLASHKLHALVIHADSGDAG